MAVLARPGVSQEPEAVDRVEGEKDEPEVEGDAGEDCEGDPLLSVGLLVAPAEERGEEGDKEDEGFEHQHDQEHFTVFLEVGTEPAGALVENCILERKHGDDDAASQYRLILW